MLTTILRRTLPIILRHAVWTLCLAEGLAHGQVPTQPELPPREVNLCDLLRNPNPYDGQRIRVRGEANRDFQDFSLHGQSCGSQVAHRVWLQYGDDKTNAGEEMEHRFIQAEPLVKDAGYTAFAESLSQQRLLQPDLRACGGSQCHYYRVTASFTGRFFAGIEPGRGRGVKTFTGFGYQGCCHLLVIEQVSDVRTERTQTPVGGQYQCSTETWTPATSDPGQIVTAAGKHWGDDTSQWIADEGSWVAADGLTSYSVETVVPAENKKGAGDPRTTVTRESCTPVATMGPRPVSEPVQCENRDWRWQEEPQAAKDLQQTVTMGHDPWRLELRTSSRNAIDDAFKQWGLLPAGPHLVDRCGNPTQFADGQSAECGWSSLDGMHTFLVRLHRFDYLKRFGGHWENVMWVATEVEGSFCKIPGEQEKQP